MIFTLTALLHIISWVSMNVLNDQYEIANQKVRNGNTCILKYYKKKIYARMGCFSRLFDKAIFSKIEMETHFSYSSYMTWMETMPS